MSSSRLVAAVAFLCLVSPCAARESWLAASDWEPRPGEEIRITGHEGRQFAGVPLAFGRGRVTRLVLRQGEERSYGASDATGVPDVSPLTIGDGRGTLLAIETAPTVELLPDEHLDFRAEEEGLTGMAALRERSIRGGRERAVTCQKIWLDGPDGRRIRRPAGLTLELVPRRDPSRVSAVDMELLFRGRPVTGALVTSWRQPLNDDGSPTDPAVRLGLPPHETLRTDRLGRVRVDVSQRGEYMIEAVHAVPCKDPNTAEWDSWWTSLAFARTGMRGHASDPPGPLRGTGLGTNPDLGDPNWHQSFSRRDWPGGRY